MRREELDAMPIALRLLADQIQAPDDVPAMCLRDAAAIIESLRISVATDNYIRRAKLVKVIDGDTIELDFDLGQHVRKTERVRLLGVDCPEMRGTTKPAGEQAKLFVIDWFEKHGPSVLTQTFKDKTDGFGRYLADVWAEDGGGMVSFLARDLIESGNAVPFRVPKP